MVFACSFQVVCLVKGAPGEIGPSGWPGRKGARGRKVCKLIMQTNRRQKNKLHNKPLPFKP